MIREAYREDIPACVNLIRHYSMQKKTINWGLIHDKKIHVRHPS